MSELERFNRRLIELEQAVRDLSSAPQLAASSIVNGSIDQVNVIDTGQVDPITGLPVYAEKLVARYGEQQDGSNIAASFDGPLPPRPIGHTVTAGPESIVVEWFGEFEERIEPYLDHDFIAVHIGTDALFSPIADTLKATMRSRTGERVTISVPAGTYYVKLVAVSVVPRYSLASPYEAGTPGQASAIDVTARALAQTALDTANGKSSILYYDYPAVPQPGDGVEGDFAYVIRPADGVVMANLEKTASGWEARPIDDMMIDNVNAGKIVTGTLDTATTITVGNPLGTHIEIGDSSLKVFRPDADGSLSETISVGGPTTDQIIITDPVDGMPIAGMFDSGALIGRTLDLDTPDGLSVGGETIDDLLYQFARGNRAGYQATATRPAITTAEYGLFEIQAELPQGRIYRVNFTGNFTHGTANGSMRLWLRSTTDGTPPKVTATPSTQLMMGWHGFTVAGLPMQKSIERYFHVGTDRWGAPVTFRCLVSAATLSGSAAFYPDSGVTPATFTIDDVGPLYEGYMLDGMASGGQGGSYSGVGTYTKTYTANWTRTWRAGSIYSGTTDAMQGTSSYGSHVSQIGFPTTLATDLAGSTVQNLKVYLYANHWYSYAGGTAVLGVHGNTAAPASFSYSGSLASTGWPRGAGRWVTLPTAWHAGFVSGASRGITLGGGVSGSSIYYGRFNGAGASSNKPVFQATFTK